MKSYKIVTRRRNGENYDTMVITDRANGTQLAEYRLTDGQANAERAGMRRALDAHLNDGGTLHNYEF